MSTGGLDIPSLLAAGAGSGAESMGGQQEQAPPDPLETLQECLNALPGVIASLPDPQDTQDAIQALHILAKVQTRMMARTQQPRG